MVLLLTQAEFGDLITYEKNGRTYGAVFIAGKKGELLLWDTGTRSCTSIENIDQNTITGFYKRGKDSDTKYILKTAFSEEAKSHRTLKLARDWRYGAKQYVGTGSNLSYKAPSLLGGIGIVIGIIALAIPGASQYETISTVLGFSGLAVAGADLVMIETFDQIQDYISHDPRAVPHPGPRQVQGTPTPPAPLY